MCDEFAIFYLTVLSEKGIKPSIVHQRYPFPHTFLVTNEMVMDKLLDYCCISYPWLKFEHKTLSMDKIYMVKV